jgi:hypothetical protein
VAFAVLLVLVLPACAPGKRVQLEPTIEIQPGPIARFAAGTRLVEGFDAFEPGRGWSPGDTVLLGIAMDAPGVSREWYIKATAIGDLPIKSGDQIALFSPRDSVRVRYAGKNGAAEHRWVRVDYNLVPVMVELFDAEAKLLSQNLAMMPEMCLQYGMIDNIELQRDGRGFYDSVTVPPDGGELVAGEEQKRFLAGWVAMMKLPDFLHRESMQGVLWQLIERPSLFSLLRNGGVSLGLGMDARRAELVEPPPLGLPAPVYRVPLEVEVNGATAMNCELMLARAVPPLGPCNALIGLDAVNPRDGRKRVTVRLLAARNLPLRAVEPPSTPPAAPAPARPAAASPAGTGP